jgi:hypothetical protein
METCSPSFTNRGSPSLCRKAERENFLKKYKTGLYEAYGNVMKEYVAVPNDLLAKTKELQKYLDVSYEYSKTLKPKPAKKR